MNVVNYIMILEVPEDEKCNPQTYNLKINPMCIRCIENVCAQCQAHSNTQEIVNPFNKSEVFNICMCDQNYKYVKNSNNCGNILR